MKPILAELLTIGDEILYGQIVDTNSQWMSVELTKSASKSFVKQPWVTWSQKFLPPLRKPSREQILF